MNVMAFVIPICLTMFTVGIGCSREQEPAYPKQKAVVRKSINMPDHKKTEAVIPARAENPEPVAKEAEETNIISIEKEEVKKEREIVKEEEAKYYLTQKGDTLPIIAGKADVYGDPLKWPILYRLNWKELSKIENDENFPYREIPAGTRLKIITPDGAAESLKSKPKKYWVINILSSPEKERIVPHVIRLIKNDSPAYITRIKVKGKDWMRLRVGFFKKKEDAVKEGEKLMALLNVSDIWTTKVGEKELGEFGGY
ncbi:SPOR domain-containing protein [Thermodesulfobacteriota bacterium]